MNTTEQSTQPTTCSSIDLHLYGEAPTLSSGDIPGHLWVNVGPAAIHGDRDLLRAFATSILTQLDTTGVDTVAIADLVVDDTISAPTWPDETWEHITRIERDGEVAHVHTATGGHYVYPADHALKVRFPRPGGVATREQGVPCRGMHSIGRKPIVWANDGLCDACRLSRAEHPAVRPLAVAEG